MSRRIRRLVQSEWGGREDGPTVGHHTRAD